MLRRLGFRRLLPVVQLVTYLLLVGPYCYQGHKLISHAISPAAQIIPVQETVEFDLNRMWGSPRPLSMLFAGMLNLPTVAKVGIATIPFLPVGPKGELVRTGSMTPFVAILWFWVGLWIDRRLGFVPQKPRMPSRLRCIAWSLVLVLSVGLLLVVIGCCAIFCVKLIGGTGAKDGEELGEFVVIFIPLAWWSSFLFAVCMQGIRDSKRAAA